MMSVVVSYILWTAAVSGQPWGIIWKFVNGKLVNCGLPLVPSIVIGVTLALITVSIAWEKTKETPPQRLLRHEKSER